jgi:hypothetical protein
MKQMNGRLALHIRGPTCEIADDAQTAGLMTPLSGDEPASKLRLGRSLPRDFGGYTTRASRNLLLWL